MYQGYLNVYRLYPEKEEHRALADYKKELDDYFAREAREGAIYSIKDCGFLNGEDRKHIRYFPSRVSSNIQVNIVRRHINLTNNMITLKGSKSVLIEGGRLTNRSLTTGNSISEDISWDFLIVKCFDEYYIISALPLEETHTEERLFLRDDNKNNQRKEEQQEKEPLHLKLVSRIYDVDDQTINAENNARTITYSEDFFKVKINTDRILVSLGVNSKYNAYYDLCRVAILVTIANTYNVKHGTLVTKACQSFTESKKQNFSNINSLIKIWEEYCEWYLNGYREYPIRYEEVGRTFELWKTIAEFYNVAQAQKEIKDKIYEIYEICKYQNERKRDSRFMWFTVVTTVILVIIGILQGAAIFIGS